MDYINADYYISNIVSDCYFFSKNFIPNVGSINFGLVHITSTINTRFISTVRKFNAYGDIFSKTPKHPNTMYLYKEKFFQRVPIFTAID